MPQLSTYADRVLTKIAGVDGTGQVGLTEAHPTSPTTIYVRSTGNDSTGDGTLAAPFLTIQKAVDVLATYDQNGYEIVIDVGAGTFAGAGLTGPMRGGAGGGDRGDLPGFVRIRGAGQASTTINGPAASGSTAGGPWCLVASGCSLVTESINIAVPVSSAGVSLINYQYYLPIDTRFTGPDASAVCVAAEGFSLVELTAVGSVDVYGTFAYVFGVGAKADLLIDPAADPGVRIFGTVGMLCLVDGHSNVLMFNTSGPVSIEGGGSATGAAYNCFGNSYMRQTTGTPMATVWGTPGVIATGGRTSGVADTPTATATGIGSTGTAVVDASSGSHAGYVSLTAGGSGIAALGTLTITFEESLLGEDYASIVPYSAILQIGTGTWNARASIIADAYISNEQIKFKWDNNSVTLTSGQTYLINYVAAG